MRDHYPYDYAVFRVVPRVEREEFVNVGVIVSCPARDFLEARVELDEQRQVDADKRNQKYDSQIEETVNLLRLFAADYELISRRQALLEIIQFRLCWRERFGCEHAGGWKAQD